MHKLFIPLEHPHEYSVPSCPLQPQHCYQTLCQPCCEPAHKVASHLETHLQHGTAPSETLNTE